VPAITKELELLDKPALFKGKRMQVLISPKSLMANLDNRINGIFKELRKPG
jgi:hypothetical protein